MTQYLKFDSYLPWYMAYPRFLLEVNISETAKLVYMLHFFTFFLWDCPFVPSTNLAEALHDLSQQLINLIQLSFYFG